MKTWRPQSTSYLSLARIACLAALLSLAGCNSAEMTHYFAAADLDEEDPTLKFFRVHVKGESKIARTNLQTGFYDAAALHSLFGMDTKRDKEYSKKPLTDPAKVVLEVDPVTGRIQAIDQNYRFTVLYGANSDALASQISAFSQNQTTGEAMARIIGAAAGQEAYTGLLSAKADLSNAETSKKNVQDELSKTATDFKKAFDKAMVGNTNNATNQALARRKVILEAISESLRKAGIVFTEPDFDKNGQLDKATLDNAENVLKTAIEISKNGGAS